MKYRAELPILIAKNGLALELGVAKGVFSDQILTARQDVTLISIDRWSDHHDFAEYEYAVGLLQRYGHRSIIKRATFDDALPQFPDAYFDFIYIDGYAHTGQEGGKTLTDWWPKLKTGGIFAGHDYHEEWPLTKQAVHDFLQSIGRRHTSFETTDGDQYPSWWMVK